MNGTSHTTGTEPTATFDECHLNELVGNNFFFGQLLTPQVFAREQALHASRVSNLTQFVLGAGVVCGLNVGLSLESRPLPDAGGEAEFLNVTVRPGLALDCCGRQLVLEREASDAHRTDDTTVSDASVLSVYLAHERCTFEPHAAVGVENACEQRCVDSLFVERGVLEVEFDDPTEPYKPVTYVDYPTEAEMGQPPEPLAAAPAGTLLIERWPDGDPTEGEAVAVGVLGGGDERLDNASTDEVTLDTGDVLVAGDGRRYLVTATAARTLPGREPGSDPASLLVAFDPTAVVTSVTETTVSGRTTAPSGTDVTVRVRSPSGSPTPLFLQVTATVEDNSFTATFVDSEGDPIPVDTPLVLTAMVPDAAGGPAVGATTDAVVVGAGTGSDATESGDEATALARVARSYYTNRPLATCETCGEDHRVLLGWFTRTGETWESTSFARGPLVYNNDLLHDAIVRHGTDFRNPHETALVVNRTEADIDEEERSLSSGETYSRGQRLLLFELTTTRTYELRRFVGGAVGDLVRTLDLDSDGDTSIETTDLPAGAFVVTNSDHFPSVFEDGRELTVELDEDEYEVAAFTVTDRVRTTSAVLTVNDLPTADEDVLLVSPDETVSITPGFERRSIEFEVAGLDGMRRRLDALEAYVLRKAIEYKPTAYSVVAETFGAAVTEFTDEIERLSNDARANAAYRDEEAFETFIEAVYAEEESLRARVAGDDGASDPLATPESLSRFATALSRLETAQDDTPRDALELALTQDGVSEAAEWLEPLAEPEPERELDCVATRDIPREAYGEDELPFGGVTFADSQITAVEQTEDGETFTEVGIPFDENLDIRVAETDYATVTVRPNGSPVSLTVDGSEGTTLTFESDPSVGRYTFEVDLDGETFEELELGEATNEQQSVVEVCIAERS
jgi:hypothetical protein